LDLGTAIKRAFEESEMRPNQPVEVKSPGDSRPIFWRVENENTPQRLQLSQRG
jgi:hypothetical protein